MSLQNDILKIFLENPGKTISGNYIAKELSVSRTAIWKNIEDLRKLGYEFDASTKKGYRILQKPDILNTEIIRKDLDDEYKHIPIYVKEITTSTNIDAKIAATNGHSDYTVFIANEQTCGRGRLGRSFFSPKNGIYMSVIINPPENIKEYGLITTAVAVAVCDAIKSKTGIDLSIKWVNDLFYNQKKVCGILCEAVLDMESSQINHIIVGIGINFHKGEDVIPNELKDIITFLFDNNPPCTRNELISCVLNQLFDTFLDFSPATIMRDYKKRMFMLGQQITFTKNDKTFTAVATDIDLTGGLVVTFPNGETKTLKTGEVSIKKL